ncbi:hypothetical protein PNEG_03056 [Pneumocystis murina B123]|uniref:G-patch domain-containing protein n=1 Tax=Pneumocystis murina (strain B123) TaxID=1069680 RepID=M7P3Z2_PNEMU|nr:hypothetical protein PNEG_03056 [Pneumocystis murina B123]EMR08580.1 hypothetical protein PNEG_03056 [Pneumocystis murina B123]
MKKTVLSDTNVIHGLYPCLFESSVLTLNDTKNKPYKLSSKSLGALKPDDFPEEILFVGKRCKELKKELSGIYKNKYKSSGNDEATEEDKCERDLIKNFGFINFKSSQKPSLSGSRKVKGLKNKVKYTKEDDAELDYIENITASGYLNYDELLKEYELSSVFLDEEDVVIHDDGNLSEKNKYDIYNRFEFDTCSIPRSDRRVWKNNRISLSYLNKRFKKNYDLEDDNYFSFYNNNLENLENSGKNVGRKKHQKPYGKVSVLENLKKDERENKKDKMVGRTFRELLLHVNDIILCFLSDCDLMDLDLVPMDSHARKWVHILADAYGIVSKSSGKKELRHVVLYKTTRVHDNYSKRHVARILQILNYKQYNFKVSRMKGSESEDNYRKISKNRHKYKYHDGDIVGKDAPEIDKDNKGRMMLEKLGWIAGNGLGAADNKGIEVPVMAVIKTTKLGLR